MAREISKRRTRSDGRPKRTARGGVAEIASLLAIASVLAGGANAKSVVSLSPDTTINLGGAGLTTADQNVVVDNQLGILQLEDLGPLPGPVDVVAYSLDLGGERLFALDTTTLLPGDVVARRGDVVRYDGTIYSIEFDALSASVQPGVVTDAVSITAGGLLLSFDTSVALPGITVADEDLVRWDGSSYTLALDGSNVGLTTALDVDAAQDLGGGIFLLSFDTAGEVDGIPFSDEDVLRFDGVTWSIELDASGADPDWATTDLDAFMVPEPSFAISLAIGILGLLTTGARWSQSAVPGHAPDPGAPHAPTPRDHARR